MVTINPNIFQIAQKGWGSTYIPKKISDNATYLRKDQEIRAFVSKFFLDRKLNVHGYHATFIERSILISVTYSTHLIVRPLVKGGKRESAFGKKFSRAVQINSRLSSYARRAAVAQRVAIKPVVGLHELEQSLLQFFKGLSFYMDQRTDIFLALHKLNHQARYFSPNAVLQLRRYQSEVFYKDGVRTLFTCGINKDAARQIASYIVYHLGRQKRHNRFLKFIKECLSLCKQSKASMFSGIKIQIKGRMNGQARASAKLIAVGADISLTSVDSPVSFESMPAHGPNGTFGVKVWVQNS